MITYIYVFILKIAPISPRLRKYDKLSYKVATLMMANGGYMDYFRLFEKKIIFVDGYYLLHDDEGNNSLITYESAKAMEIGHYKYMADMDVGRGGMDPKYAYSGRGFQEVDNAYVYTETLVIDQLANGYNIKAIPPVFTLPEYIGAYAINYIAKHAFADNKTLKAIVVPDRVKSIELGAFKNCVNLASVMLPTHALSIGKEAFANTLLEKSSKATIFSIGRHIIKASTLTEESITIDSGFLSIADEAFMSMSQLKSVNLPDSIDIIGHRAFADCKALTRIRLPECLDLLGESAFRDCISLEALSVSKNVRVLRTSLFENCMSLSHIKLPDTLKKIEFYVFRNCKVVNDFNESKETMLYIDKWLIDYKATMECFRMLDGTIGSASFDTFAKSSERSTIRNVTLPTSFKYLGAATFDMCKHLESICLPDGLRVIEKSAFRRCSCLKEVTIPKSVEKIDYWAFMGCDNIEQFHILGKDTEIIAPAITGRADKRIVKVYGQRESCAESYCQQYGEKYGLSFCEE